jgi:hypothetical protein
MRLVGGADPRLRSSGLSLTILMGHDGEEQQRHVFDGLEVVGFTVTMTVIWKNALKRILFLADGVLVAGSTTS